MEVSIGEPGKDAPAAQVDLLRIGGARRARARQVSDEEEPSASNRHGSGKRTAFLHRVKSSLREYDIGTHD